MRARLASLLFSTVVLTAAVAAAAPAKHAQRITELSAHLAAPSSSATAAKPTSFVRAGQGFKDNFGVEWLGKAAKGDAQDLDRLGNEHAAAAIYKLAEPTFGTTTPDVLLATIDGKSFLMSRKIVAQPRPLSDEQLKKFGEGFVIDAWLANWNVGGGWQLTADAAGNPVRIDGAGAGLFRAQGDPKGAAFGEEVTELQTMRDPLRPLSVGFRKVTERDVRDQLQKFAAWYPARRGDIETAIDATSMSPAAAVTLKAKLATRAQWLINQAKK